MEGTEMSKFLGPAKLGVSADRYAGTVMDFPSGLLSRVPQVVKLKRFQNDPCWKLLAT
jgi:hypothetical protein